MKKIPFYCIKAVVTKTGNNAKNIASEYGAEYYSTDYKDIILDPNINLVLIATRHNLHAPVIIDAANAKKNIYVEKPVAMSYDDCKKVYDAVKNNGVSFTIGFNRRMSPLAQKAKRLIEKRKNPIVMTYRINSAGMKKDHWINDPVEGGGAIIGEGCHFFDFCNWMVGHEPVRIYGEMLSSNDSSIVNTNNVACTIKYDDGSVASIVYTTTGNASFSKELVEIYSDGGVVSIDDFKELKIVGLGVKGESLAGINKGQYELIYEFGKYLLGHGISKDIPTVEDGVKATICSLKLLDAIKTGAIQPIENGTYKVK